MSQSLYEWVRRYQGLTQLRKHCSIVCWTSDSAWIEWKNSLVTPFEFGLSRIGSTPLVASWLTTLGMRWQFNNDSHLFETNTAVLKNVLRLRISKSLTCAGPSERLNNSHGYATRRWNSYVYDTEGWQMSVRTSSKSSRPANSNRA